jgi:mannose-6-phosphate isomerase-like protein (cupin superfamily)
VACGGKKALLLGSQPTFLLLGKAYYLINSGKVPLKFIEASSEACLGGYEIVRFEVAYGRA